MQHGSKPEVLIKETHEAIRKIFLSIEGREFFNNVDSTDEARISAGDKVVMSVIEAVAHIIPIALRDKALDGG